MDNNKIPLERVLIFRVGSMGDTVLAVPSFRLIARAFPIAERCLLTYISGNQRATPLRSVLDGTGLIHSYLEYSEADRGLAGMSRLRRRIRAWKPDLMVYLMDPKGLAKILRDAAFFRVACGIPKVIGLPLSRDRRSWRVVDKDGNVEQVAERLARSISELGDPHLEDASSWDLQLSQVEHRTAATALSALPPDQPLLAASIGSKLDVNDWGDRNWASLLESLSRKFPSWSLVMVGAQTEAARTELLLKKWSGARLSLCGNTSVRVSAAVLSRAKLYVGHDSGPLHLAAAVGTPCVAIFSARNPPGQWFPYGVRHRVLYHAVPCRGCALEVCIKKGKLCIASITVPEVEAQVMEQITLTQQNGTELIPATLEIEQKGSIGG